MFYLIISFWLIRTARAVLFWAWLWQLKEYRFDRFRVFFSAQSGKRVLFNKLLFLKIILLFCFLFSSIALPFVSNLAAIFNSLEFLTTATFFLSLILILYFLESAKGFKDFYQKKIKRPVFTKKAILILFFNSLFFISIPIFLWAKIQSGQIIYDIPPLIRFCSWLLLIDILTPIIISLIILSFKPLTIFLKARIIQKAKNKIAKYPNLIVIGITGSYGKTSTKEFLYTILSEKFDPVKSRFTPLNLPCNNLTGRAGIPLKAELFNRVNVLRTVKANTDIGVAKVILSELKPEHQIFIVEMGAYKRGEIKAICDIVKPKIGILTGINEQHLALFGSLENTTRAKFELIEALPENGLAVINSKLKTPAQILLRKNYSGRAKFFSIDKKTDIYASDIKIEKDKIKFKIISGEASENFEINLIGKQNVSNILACVAVTEHLGMSLKEISEAVKKIKPLKKTMSAINTENGLTLIDDTYNANPAGVLAALEYLKNFGDNSGRKIILFPGIIELGSATKKVHQSLGKKMAEICDLIIITKKDFAEYIINGKKFILQENPEKVYQILKNYLKPGDVVLFESRGMESVLERLKGE